MSTQPSDRNLALFIDFDNVALGARDARMRFDCRLLLQRVLEKGKVVVKRAYADWHHYKEHMTSLHEAAIELIEVPMPRISGKNSADIRMVVDAIDLCWSKDHIDTFVLVSGDSDFSPLVSKLRENNKRVIGVGMRNSSSHLLISNCDEWIFYDDIYQTTVVKLSERVASVPADKRELFDFLLNTTQSLLQESRGVLFSSLVKDTMKRKQPDFNETNYGYATFGDLLEDMRDHGLITVERDSRAGGTLVVLGLGKTDPLLATRTKARRSRRGRERDRNGGERETDASLPDQPVAASPRTSAEVDTAASRLSAEGAAESPLLEDPAAPGEERSPARRSRRRSSRRRRGGRADGTSAGADAGDLDQAGPQTAGSTAATPPAEPRGKTPPDPKPVMEAPRESSTTRKTTARKKTARKTTVTADVSSRPAPAAPTPAKPATGKPTAARSTVAKPASPKPSVKPAPVKPAPAKPAPAKPAPAKPAPARTAKKGAKKVGRGRGGSGRGEE